MKKKMMTAAFLAALLLTACGSTGTVDSIAENGDTPVESQTADKPTADHHSECATLDPTTGILTLSGKVTQADLEPYSDNEEVKTIYAMEGTVFPEDCSKLFYDFLDVETIDISQADTSAATNMAYMFASCMDATEIKLGNIDTSHVTTMDYMFWECRDVLSLDLSGLDSSSVETLDYMFSSCWSVQNINLTGFSCPNAKSAKYMFEDCGSLPELDVSGMDMSNLVTMESMFEDCASLKELDLSAWNTPNLGSMFRTFNCCRSLQKLDLSGLSTEKCIMLMNDIFNGCEELTTIIVSDKWVLEGDARLSKDPFLGCVKLVGGNGTVYDESKNSPEFMRIDTPEAPGLFTAAG